MSLKDDLIAARALIDTPEKWAKGASPLDGPERPCFCTYTACFEAVGGTGDRRYYDATNALDDAVPATFVHSFRDCPAVAFNDDPATIHNDVLALFDRAIEAAS
jgi:hypothetical protein